MSHSEELNYFDQLVKKLQKMKNITVKSIDIHYHKIYLIFQEEEITIKVDNGNLVYNYETENTPGLQSAIDEVLKAV